MKRANRVSIRLAWNVILGRILLIVTGTLLGALSVIIFFAPANIAPGGVTGVAVILNEFVTVPIGLFVMIANVPILIFAYYMLADLRSVMWTIFVVVLYSFAIDILTPFFPPEGVSDNGLLNAIFAGVVGGVGGGMIFRGGGTFGGTSTLGRIMQVKLGIPLSSTYLYLNMLIVLAAGVFLGWESALFSLVALVVEGMASDYTLEGPSVIRTATIITDHPRDVSGVILYQMKRGVTGWEATGMYSGERRNILFVTVTRSQVSLLRQLVIGVDPAAFIVIGQGHVAYGGDFKRKVPGNGNGNDSAYDQPEVETSEFTQVRDAAEATGGSQPAR